MRSIESFERQCGRSLAQIRKLHVWELRPPELQEAAHQKFEEIRTVGRGSAELAEQIEELRRWHEATLGIGMRNIELNREMNKLLCQAGQPPRYLGAEQE